MRNILVTGANGQVGSELQTLSRDYADHFYFTDKDTLDITDQDQIDEFIRHNAIDVIINAAAYTAVDRAEEDEENADKVNHLAVKYLAQAAKSQGITLIHISTDYVFDGSNCKPYTEEDVTHPQGVYGATKLAGEKVLLDINPQNSLIVRTSWVYSSFGANFVKTMLHLGKEREQLGVVFDQVGTPTYARDLAQAILQILPRINNQHVAIYHYTNEGVCSWYDFAKAIMQKAQLECHVNPIETKEYPTPAKRPHYSVLNKGKIKRDFQLTIPHWKESLDVCLEILENPS